MEKTVGICTMEKFDNRLPNSVGSSRIRMRWLLPYWEEAEEYIIGKKYEAMIFQKVYWAEMMDAFQGVKILDLCDPDWLEGRPVFEFVDRVDAVTTSTEALADYIRKLRPQKKHILCIPDRVYMPEAEPVKQEYGDKLRTVVWFGYSHNAHYLFNTLDEIIARGLELVCVADQPIEPPMSYRNQIRITNVAYSYATANKEMIKYDAVLMPQPTGDERGKYKSNNKTLQAWALGMPVIKVPDDIDKFMTMEARKEEGQQRRKEIEEKWDVKYSVSEYQELIKQIKIEKGL